MQLLADAETRVALRLGDQPPEQLPEIAAWRDAYRSFGAKPQRTRPSVEVLVRRVHEGFPRIARITDTYNAISVVHLLLLVGEDAGKYVGPARLARATGNEIFETLAAGENAVEHPDVDEVIWEDDAGVTCRRWNWRQSLRTRISDSTTSALFVVDGLLDMTAEADLLATGDDLQSAISRFSPSAHFTTRLIGPETTSPTQQH